MLSSFLFPLPPLQPPKSSPILPTHSLIAFPASSLSRERSGERGSGFRYRMKRASKQQHSKHRKYHCPPALQYHNFINLPQTRNSKSGGSPCRILEEILSQIVLSGPIIPVKTHATSSGDFNKPVLRLLLAISSTTTYFFVAIYYGQLMRVSPDKYGTPLHMHMFTPTGG